MPFLHGVETIVNNSGPVPVTVVKSSVIGIVGISPIGTKNTLIAVNSKTDAAQFGELVPGFSIPQALDAILKQGAGSILVVNVFDATTHTAQVTDEVKTVASGKLKLAYPPIGTVTVKNNDGSPATIVLGTDYTFDAFGNFVAISSAVSNGTSYKFSYKKLDASTITASVIIGTYNSGTGARTGIQCLDLAKNQVGYNAKILITPGYSNLPTVAAELISKATNYRAIALIDAPYGNTVAASITDRGLSGTNGFNTSSKRALLLYPYLKRFDTSLNANTDEPYSQWMAGVMAATDISSGFWYSPSNKEIIGIVGAERNISAGASDINSDANQLNAAGVTTIFNSFGTGIRTWGNRSAAYPTITTPDNFISVQRTADVVHESLENAALQFIDRPITQALIDLIRESGNSFIRTLIQRGALITGSKIVFDKAKNPDVEIAAGHLTFDIVMMPPVPGERITFNSFIDITLLNSLQ